ncbi:hypothetical protein AAFC00_005511 [Neodothiora populina]
MNTTDEVDLATPDEAIDRPSTPPTQRLLPSELSPPDSQGGVSLHSDPVASAMPTVALAASGANANGKRPRDLLDTSTEESSMTIQANGVRTDVAGSDQTPASTLAHSLPPKVHAASGYSYTCPEDAPGYAWQNRKAQEEAGRSWEQGVVNKDRTVGTRYGDPFEMADREAAMMRRAVADPSMPTAA